MIEIIDNFLDKRIFSDIQQKFYSNHFPWYYNESAVTVGYENIYDQMFHMFFRSSDGFHHRSPELNAIQPILLKLRPAVLIRVKANMSSAWNGEEELAYHTDTNLKGATTAILYFSTNDGYTIFENGDIIETIENRLIKFPAEMRHGVKRHTSGKNRVVLNINWIDYD